MGKRPKAGKEKRVQRTTVGNLPVLAKNKRSRLGGAQEGRAGGEGGKQKNKMDPDPEQGEKERSRNSRSEKSNRSRVVRSSGEIVNNGAKTAREKGRRMKD